MKKNLLIIFCIFITLVAAQSQTTFYGTTLNGGSNSKGTIFTYQPASNSQHIINLDAYLESPLGNSFIQGSDGKLYGMTTYGGVYGYGAIFSFDTVTNIYTDIHDFNKTQGSYPYGGLTQLTNGLFYGVTSSGGANSDGVIFSFNPIAGAYLEIYDFDGAHGAEPPSGLIQASDGKLYGLALSGGANGFGAIFSFDPTAAVYTDIHDFDGAGGEQPEGNLFQAADGKFYGVASYGGANSSGVIFSMDTSASHVYTDLFDFNGTDGLNPYCGLIQASDGKLYGLTANGGAGSSGVIFSMDTTTTHIYTDLFDFNGTTGSNPYGSLIQGQDGMLYGTASGGGANSYGVIFSFSISPALYTDILDFTNANGSTPYSGLFQLSNGKLLGMTLNGGSAQFGVIYSMDPATITYSLLDNFGTNLKGSHAAAGMLLASDGSLYGMTIYGGKYGNGVIFKIDTASLSFTVVYNFDGMHGANPYGSLIQGADGKLYGMTSAGGVNIFNYFGAIFSYDPVSAVYTDLYDFDGVTAANPSGSLLEVNDGKIYGMTSGLYTPSAGNIFSLDPLSATYTNIYNFDTAGGYQPYGNLIQTSDGTLYGLTLIGGMNNYGTIFSYVAATAVYTNLYNFTGQTGSGGFPYGSLLQGSDKKLYGMTSAANASNIFSFDPSTSSFTNLQNLGSSGPQGNLMQVADSLLYGMTSTGGTNSDGNIFSYNLNSTGYADLFDFNGTNGANPGIGSTLLAIHGISNLPISLLDFYATLKADNTVLLQWQTAQEQNSSYFDVEKSADGKTFFSLGKVAAAGNSSVNLSYSFRDPAPLSGNNFYRLSMVDLDGKQKYSQVLLISTGAAENSLQILHNPFTDAVTLQINVTASNQINIVLTDILGRILERQSFEAQAGVNYISISPPQGSQAGTYILNIKSNPINRSVKIIKQ